MAHKRPPSQHLYAEMEANVLKFYGSFTRRNAGHILSQNGLIIFKMDVPNTLHYSLLYNESKIGRVSF